MDCLLICLTAGNRESQTELVLRPTTDIEDEEDEHPSEYER